MTTIVKRITKGTILTVAELDANVANLNSTKLEVAGGTLTGLPVLANQDVDIISPVYPTTKPSLNLDFTRGQLDPRVTFARNSTAAYYDGKSVAKAEENLFKYSQDFSNSAGGIWYKPNLTTTASSSSIAPDGTNTATLITPNTANWQLSQALESGSTNYTISVYAKVDSGTATFRLFGKNTLMVSSDLTVTTSWQRFTLSYVGAASNASGLAFSSTGNVTPFYIWGAQLEQRTSVTAYTPTTTAPITNYIPVMKFAPANVPRFDYDPITGKPLGLLIEEGRSNLLTYSQDFSNGVWAKSTSTLYYNYVVAPDGTQTATLLGPTVSVCPFQQITWIPGTTYVYSIYVKAITGATLNFRMSGANSISGDQYRTFTASTGTIVRVTGDLSSIQTATPVGNGWYRLVMVSVANNNYLGYVSIESGNGFAVWGAQLEVSGSSQAIRSSTIGTGSTTTDIILDSGASSVDGTYVGNNLSVANTNMVKTISAYIGATKTATVSSAFATAPSSGATYYITPATMTVAGFATSYIPTPSNQAVSRQPDQASMVGSNFSSWYNQSEGSFFASADYSYAGIPTIYGLEGASTIRCFVHPTLPRVQIGQLNSFDNSASVVAISPKVIFYNSMAYINSGVNPKIGNIKLAVNGVYALGADTLQTYLVNNIVSFSIGNITNTNFLNGHIKKLTYYPKALPSTELQALTS